MRDTLSNAMDPICKLGCMSLVNNHLAQDVLVSTFVPRTLIQLDILQGLKKKKKKKTEILN